MEKSAKSLIWSELMTGGSYWYAYLAYFGAYLGAQNMVKWGVPEKVLQNALTLGQLDLPVKSYDRIWFLADFPTVIIIQNFKVVATADLRV